jgi:hypothetical protein
VTAPVRAAVSRTRRRARALPLPNPRSFAWDGWGGSVIVVDLDAGIVLAAHTWLLGRR